MPSRNAILILASVLLTACGGGGGGDNPASGSAPDPAKAAIVTNADIGISITKQATENNALPLTRKSTGEAVTYFAQRSDAGNIVSFDEALYSKSGVKTRMIIGDKTRQFVSESGLRLKLSVTASGTVVAEYSDPASGKSLITNVSALTTTKFPVFTNHAAVQNAAVVHADSIPVTIQTKLCGDVGDIGPVRLSVSAGSYSTNYSASSNGNGTYTAYIPNYSKQMAISLQSAKDFLTSAKNAANETCSQNPDVLLTAGTVLCTKSAAAIAAASALAGTPLAASWITLCESGVAAALAYCDFLNFAKLDVPPGVDTPGISYSVGQVEDAFIDLIPANINLETIQAYTDSIGGVDRSETKSIDPNATSASLSIEDNDLVVSDIVLQPAAPAQNQSYSATSELKCMPAGTSVLAIRGTDGYANSTQHTFTDALTKLYTVVLVVPGALSGVHDTLTLTVTRTLGGFPPITKTASLVFQ